ncbi:MAG: phosphoribosylformylglycinamidine synthase [Gammaproteobacteria bacterium]|nr:phosphoribosylformylglycinamidine synthase [Gammaproteobacteria bacterium]
MLHLPGAPALSDFRLAKLLNSLREIDSRVTGVSARFQHFADLHRPLEAQEAQLLARLLTYGPRLAAGRDAGQVLLVVPRPGTTSPWSSKATDIAHVCGLDAVHRIERGTAYWLESDAPLPQESLLRLAAILHDRMIETVLPSFDAAAALFETHAASPLATLPLAAQGRRAFEEANASLGLALSPDEIDYLVEAYGRLGRDPTDVEVMMFAQANSEHCRHKIFNAQWTVDGEPQPKSLFQMIRNTHAVSPEGVLSAYKDNAAVVAGPVAPRFFADPHTGRYGYVEEPVDVLMKVETHNHPTAISPFPGAATGSGGEIRDEGATGRGAKPKAGLVGFSVSNLRIPGFEREWEQDNGKPARIASALEIMLAGPLGGAAFNNEFGRPNIYGYFRSFELTAPGDAPGVVRGYHKPIMIAGGMGNVRRMHVEKAEVPPGAHLVVLGGPAMLIGLGGGAASSVGSGTSAEDLDFASVQRGNPEIQRRAQEVIDRCWALGDDNPILLIHDVGAGGLSNALPEAIAHSERGGVIDLRRVPNDEPGMSPLEIWCNEAQERYVLVIADDRIAEFEALCARERCPYAVVGRTTDDGILKVEDPKFGNAPVDMPIEVLLGKAPRMLRDVRRVRRAGDAFDGRGIDAREALYRLLRLPTVADKTFLVTIGDRSVGGLISRDPMVGPWQVPVADVAVTLTGFRGNEGEAMAMGERTPLALLDGPASGRMAIGEALTNIVAADVPRIGEVRLSANWMAACGQPGEDAALFDTVYAVGEELCPALGIAIPVGKDSLSMRSSWRQDGVDRAVVAPVSLIVSAFAPADDVRRTLTPELRLDSGETCLLLIDLGAGRDRLGGSCLAQVYSSLGSVPPDLDDAERMKGFFAAVRRLAREGIALAYHDRSDGGVAVTLAEMAFTSRCGLEIDLGDVAHPVAAVFAEELGAVVQVGAARLDEALAICAAHGIGVFARVIGQPVAGERVVIRANGTALIDELRDDLRRAWSETTWQMQRMRDNPECADEEHAARTAAGDPGLQWQPGFDTSDDVAAPYISIGARPRVAILREQGVNSQTEMAAVFERAGFAPEDVHMTDILAGRVTLADYRGAIACGGFSYGDTLGAGEGWAKSILFHPRARDEFAAFFGRQDTFALGICNGCQMMAAIKELVPGAGHWPRFVLNRSEQFEARVAMVEVAGTPSVFFAGMAGSRLPIVVAHGEGRAEYDTPQGLADSAPYVTLRWVDNAGHVTERYPANPNGSPGGVAGLTTLDGRVTIAMPHPERVYRSVQNSWHPRDAGEDSGWMRMFRNARRWLG